MSRRVGKKC